MLPSLIRVHASASGGMDASLLERNVRLVRRLARIGAALTLCVLALAAFMRLQGHGIGCVPWPECAQAVPAQSADAPAWARLAHRIAAMLVSLCALTIALCVLPKRAGPGMPRGRTIVAVVIVVALSVLGRRSGASQSAEITFANLMLGMGLAATFASMAAWASPGRAATGPSRTTPWLIGVVMVLGSIDSAWHVGRACAGTLGCTAVEASAGAGRWLAGSHHLIGAAVILWVIAQAWRAWRAGERDAATLASAAAAATLAVLGVIQWYGITSPALAVGHHLAAGIVLVAAVLGAGGSAPNSIDPAEAGRKRVARATHR